MGHDLHQVSTLGACPGNGVVAAGYGLLWLAEVRSSPHAVSFVRLPALSLSVQLGSHLRDSSAESNFRPVEQ